MFPNPGRLTIPGMARKKQNAETRGGNAAGSGRPRRPAKAAKPRKSAAKRVPKPGPPPRGKRRAEGAADLNPLLAAAVAHLAEGVMITGDDLDWPGPEILYVNDAMCRISGYDRSDLIGKTPRILQGSGSERARLDRLRDELHAGRPGRAELTNYRKDGTPYTAQVMITPVFDEAGNRTNFVSVHSDVTARDKVRLDLEESQDRLRAVLNTAADAIITINSEGVMEGVNPAAEKMFGYDEQEMIGRNVKILLPSPHRERHDEYIARYLRTGEARIIGIGRELTGVRKDGSEFPIELAVSKLYHLNLFTGIVRDITDRRELQAEVLRANEEERERIAREIHDGVSQRLAGISLEAATLKRRLKRHGAAESELFARLARDLQTSIRDIRRAIQDLAPLELTGGDLGRALAELADRTTERTGFDCRLNAPPSLILKDSRVATHLLRIVAEAVHNAVKHSGGTRIDIGAVIDDGTLLVSVSDNGAGLHRPGRKKEVGFGLKIMEHRTKLISGEFDIGGTPGGGLRIECRVPL